MRAIALGSLVTHAALCPNCGLDLIPDEPISRGPITMTPYGNCQWHGKPLKLTPGEKAVLWAILKADGGVVSRNALNERIGYENDYNVVDVYLSRIRRKMNAIAPHPIETIHGLGLRLAISADA